MTTARAQVRRFVTGRLSTAEKELIEDMADDGWRPSRIARAMNRHPGTINYHLVMHGYGAARQCAPLTYRRGNSIDGRSSCEVRSFNNAEDEFITELRQQGMNFTAIGRECRARFGHLRKGNSIKLRLCMLAARDEGVASVESTPLQRRA